MHFWLLDFVATFVIAWMVPRDASILSTFAVDLVFSLILSAGCAAVSYHYIEVPGLSLMRKDARA
jgi:peptidoglycan/LPS O-acetylase OafA/YrhL